MSPEKILMIKLKNQPQARQKARIAVVRFLDWDVGGIEVAYPAEKCVEVIIM